jgi:peptidoglycan/xylan/chitin deacetylase (PgdA/CDA1 family)
VTGNGLWRPGADPNARTQALAEVPQQRGAEPDPAPDLARTALYEGGDGGGRGGGDGFGGPERGPDGSGRRPSRRRVLFAAGGLMLLTGGGVAAALASSSGTNNTAAGSPSASTTPSEAVSSAPASTQPPSSPAPSPSVTPSVAKSPQYYVDDQGPMAIALTMDDGPHPVWTPQVLEILRRYDIKATFNMVGQQVGANLSLVREVAAAGHTITNHTWNHANLASYTTKQVLTEIDRTNEALANAGQHPTIFRAPYGNWSPAVYEACAERQLRPVDWSIDPRDWDTSQVTTQMIVHYVLNRTHAHDIILEHDGGGNRSNTVAALKQFIPVLLERGYHFVAM